MGRKQASKQSKPNYAKQQGLSIIKDYKFTVFFEIAAAIGGVQIVGGGRRRRDLKGVALNQVRGAGADTEQVRVGDEAKRLVVLGNACFVVPFGFDCRRGVASCFQFQ